MALPSVKALCITTGNVYQMTHTGTGLEFATAVDVPANTSADPRLIEFEIYVNEKASGTIVGTTQDGATDPGPSPEYTVVGANIDPDTLPEGGGSVSITAELEEDDTNA
jgi:hypothetical protein